MKKCKDNRTKKKRREPLIHLRNDKTKRDVPFAPNNCWRIHGIHKFLIVLGEQEETTIYLPIDHLLYFLFRWINAKNVSVRMHACIQNVTTKISYKQREITTHIAQLNRFSITSRDFVRFGHFIVCSCTFC